MHRFVHFDIYADNVDRAAGFYSSVFGWDISRWDDGTPEMDYRLIIMGEDSPCPEGGITRRPPSGMADVNYAEVETIEDYLPRVESAGGKVLQAKIPIPGIGYIAICQDSESNPIGLFQNDDSISY